jgi:2-phospho-L-lactate transferase/gluconeogenesis factor (CofD/UPF0052 family)
MKIVLFCGGRGSSNLIKELADDSDVELTLIVNAYDDGLSTGKIRRLIPGMLGPSDFRKNLGYLLVPASEDHLNFQKILEHRLNFDNYSEFPKANESKLDFYHNLSLALIGSDSELSRVFALLADETKGKILSLIASFLGKVCKELLEDTTLQDMEDFAVGNILLAGAYIQNGNSFSNANDLICSLFDIRARIVNVSDENRFLAALTNHGELVRSEADIVAGKFQGEITEVFLLLDPISDENLEEFKTKISIHEKHQYLSRLESIPALNSGVQDILSNSDIIIFGSGTQHSSLFPTYKVLARNNVYPPKLSTKIFVSNLEQDSDIIGWSGERLLKGLTRHFRVDSSSEVIDLIIADKDSPIRFEVLDDKISLHVASLRSASNYQVHDGRKLADQIFLSLSKQSAVDIEIRIFSSAKHSEHGRMWLKVQDFGFNTSSEKVDCQVIELEDASMGAIRYFNEWITDDLKSRFLVLYSCEGETRIEDLLAGIELMKRTKLGVLSGSRTQARRQWLEATGRTYGEGRLRFGFSIAATILAVFISMVRRRQLLTDPLSRCIMIDRAELKIKKNFSETYLGKTIPGLRTFFLTKNIDVAEYPIQYRVFKGYKAYRRPTKDALYGFFEIMSQPK